MNKECNIPSIDEFMQLITNEEQSSKEKPMYKKKEIYLGLQEVSFEELLAERWERQRKFQLN